MATLVQELVASMRAIQTALLIISTGLQLTGYMFPPPSTVPSGSSFDFIIVGGGSAGSVIANRLCEVENFNVLLIESGGDLPFEAMLPGLFTTLPHSVNDHNYTSENNGYSNQHTKDNVAALTAGRMLGGGSSMNHMLHVRGNRLDYDRWAEAAQDDSWNYDSLLEYFMKSDNLQDPEIRNSSSGSFHGRTGYLRVARQVSDTNARIYQAFAELGIQYALDINHPNFTLGIGEPLLNTVGGRRFGTGDYLTALIGRPNFTVIKHADVTRVLFDDNNNAIGVEAVTAAEEILTLYASNEVILTAGALSTPKLLMLSGIGPREHLEALDIPVRSDLPVGQNLGDHFPAALLIGLEEGPTDTRPPVPREMPVAFTDAFLALNRSQSYPDYETLNLIITPNSVVLLQMCSLVHSYKDEICQGFYDSVAGRTSLYVVANMLHPQSRGEVLLRSTDPADKPIINHGIYSNEADLDNMGRYLQDFSRILETEPFRAAGAFFVRPDLPECNDLEFNTYEFWRCYALAMSNTMYEYSGTAALGSVLDNRLRVRGVQGLRVADGSAVPSSVSSLINAAIVALAEKGADLIKADHGVFARPHKL